MRGLSKTYYYDLNVLRSRSTNVDLLKSTSIQLVTTPELTTLIWVASEYLETSDMPSGCLLGLWDGT